MCEGDKPQHLAGLRRANEQVGILPLCEVDDDCVTRNLSKLVKCRREGIWRVNSGLVNVARPCNHWRVKDRAWRVESGLINVTRPSRSGGRKRTWVHLCRLDGVHCRPSRRNGAGMDLDSVIWCHRSCRGWRMDIVDNAASGTGTIGGLSGYGFHGGKTERTVVQRAPCGDTILSRYPDGQPPRG